MSLLFSAVFLGSDSSWGNFIVYILQFTDLNNNSK